MSSLREDLALLFSCWEVIVFPIEREVMFVLLCLMEAEERLLSCSGKSAMR